jgi:DNA-binding MarR family transcriptional regulator
MVNEMEQPGPPVGPKEPPAGPKQPLAAPNDLPVRPEALPVRTEGLPVRPEALPVRPEALPARPEGLPVRPEALPTRPEGPPAGLAGLPADELHETANLLHSATLRLLRMARSADVEMDLDGPRASLLSVLVFGGPQPVTRLAQLEQVSPPAITKLVTALERAGLALRERDPGDRRMVLVAATPAGRRLLERGRAARVKAVASLLQGTSPPELAALRHAANLIAARLSS